MLIDWFTVGAQAVNFLVLVWLLQHFLYKPILLAIAAREQRVATELAEAEANRARTQAERDELAKKVAVFDAGTAAQLSAAVREAGAEKERLLTAARVSAADLRRDDASALRREGEQLGRDVTELASRAVGEATRQALRDLAGADLEQAMAGEFLRRLAGLPPARRAALAAALHAPGAAALIRSSFELPVPLRAAVQDGLNRALSAEVPVTFGVDASVICGIEWDLAGQRLAWSVAEYLRGLELDTAALIAAQAAADPPAAPTSPANVAVTGPGP
jgi:F-type H+-transporting ATPase subunit b